jgi:ATP-dependent Clp protease ATP-binding subunit ClpB
VRAAETPELDSRIEKIGVEAARRKFSPEFMNRLDKVVVFRSLTEVALRQILDIEIAAIQRRILASGHSSFVISCSGATKDFLLREGFDRRYGARPLKRVMEKYLVIPFSNLVATRQVGCGDVVQVDVSDSGDELSFRKLPCAKAATMLGEWPAQYAPGQVAA